jgi:hypothetical protein
MYTDDDESMIQHIIRANNIFNEANLYKLKASLLNGDIWRLNPLTQRYYNLTERLKNDSV